AAPGLAGLDVQRRPRPLQPHPHTGPVAAHQSVGAVEVSLRHRLRALRPHPPAVAAHQELPLDLDRHRVLLRLARTARWTPRAPYAGTCPSPPRCAASIRAR